jgi:hypothetical protein
VSASKIIEGFIYSTREKSATREDSLPLFGRENIKIKKVLAIRK